MSAPNHSGRLFAVGKVGNGGPCAPADCRASSASDVTAAAVTSVGNALPFPLFRRNVEGCASGVELLRLFGEAGEAFILR